MRNDAFAVPIDFTWRVAYRGYRWITQSGERYLCAVDALEKPLERDLLNRNRRTYRPLEEHTGLFREFAELRLSKAQLSAFANRYGPLGVDSHLEYESPGAPALVHGEKLQDWRKEIRAMRTAVTLSDAISGERAETLVGFNRSLRPRTLPLEVRRRLHLHSSDPALAARSVVQRATDARLTRHVVARLVLAGDQSRLQVSLAPQNLLGALWLQFAASVDALKTFQKCDQCGAPFEISRDPRTGKRIDSRFCRISCRVKNHRQRKRRARRLHEAGLSESEIARELKTRPQTVRGWLM
jgi:hypothetical protein